MSFKDKEDIVSSRLQRVEKNTDFIIDKRMNGSLNSNGNSDIIDSGESQVDFDTFKRNVVSFCENVTSCNGSKTCEILTRLNEMVFYSQQLPIDIDNILDEYNFYEYALKCLNTEFPTLLLHILTLYSTLVNLSSTITRTLVLNRTVKKICDLFPISPYSKDIFEVYMNFFTNFSDDSPESRFYLIKIGTFHHVCCLIVNNDDLNLVFSTCSFIFSFFPESRIPMDDEIAKESLMPLKLIFNRLITLDVEKTPDLTMEKKMDILISCLSAIQYYCINSVRRQQIIELEIPQILLSSLSLFDHYFKHNVLKTVSAIITTASYEELKGILPFFNIDMLCQITDPISCDILECIFLLDPNTIQEALKCGVFNLFIRVTEDGSFSDKQEAITMIATIILNASVQEVQKIGSNAIFITELLDYWDVKKVEKGSPEVNLLLSSFTILAKSGIQNDCIKEILEEYDCV